MSSPKQWFLPCCVRATWGWCHTRSCGSTSSGVSFSTPPVDPPVWGSLCGQAASIWCRSLDARRSHVSTSLLGWCQIMLSGTRSGSICATMTISSPPTPGSSSRSAWITRTTVCQGPPISAASPPRCPNAHAWRWSNGCSHPLSGSPTTGAPVDVPSAEDGQDGPTHRVPGPRGVPDVKGGALRRAGGG